MAIIGAHQLAKALNVSARRVYQLADEGMPKAERGRYDLVPCLEWYVRYLQRAVEHRESLTDNSKVITSDNRRGC